MKYLFKHSCELRVRYGETDQMGYCYYGNYAQYCEVGRVEALRNIGMTYRKMEENGVMLPVSDFSIRYIQPARYDDLITIETRILEIKGVKLLFDYQLFGELGNLLATASTTLVFVAKDTMSPIKPPQSFLDKINSVTKTTE